MPSLRYAIEAVDLARKFGELVAVDHVNFKVEEGELWGLLGPNFAENFHEFVDLNRSNHRRTNQRLLVTEL